MCLHAVNSTQISTMLILIKCSKTEQFGKGVTVYFSWTGTSLHPVSALLGYLLCCGTQSGPLFLFVNGQPLTRVKLVTLVRKTLTSTGLDVSKNTGLSFRILSATTALRAGLLDAKSKFLGRQENSAYQFYLHTPREQLASVSSVLAATIVSYSPYTHIHKNYPSFILTKGHNLAYDWIQYIHVSLIGLLGHQRQC